MRLAVVFLVIAFPRLGSAAPSAEHDVTALVKRETDLDEKIADACRQHCQGNRRKGELKRITVARSGPSYFIVRAAATLVNRQYQKPPKVFGHKVGGGVQVYSYTIDVEARGTLDDRTCDLRIERIHVKNDRFGLGRLAKREEGKVHRIKNCRRFVAGL